MQYRSNSLEILDNPHIEEKDIKSSLDFIVHVNRYFGGTKAILDYFEKNCHETEFTVLDLGTGSGDIPYALVAWAEEHDKKIQITALDINSYCIDYGKRRFPSANIIYKKMSAFDIDRLGSFDYITSSMFFHHLKDNEVLKLLSLIRQCAIKGFVINDLYRGYLSYMGSMILGLLSFKWVTLHDATLSVARGFKERDFQKYLEELHWEGVSIERKPMCRIVMSYHADAL